MQQDKTYGFSSFTEKTRKSHHLQRSLQRQHFLLGYFKTLSVGLDRVWTHGLLLSRLVLSLNSANKAAVSKFFMFYEIFIFLSKLLGVMLILARGKPWPQDLSERPAVGCEESNRELKQQTFLRSRTLPRSHSC